MRNWNYNVYNLHEHWGIADITMAYTLMEYDTYNTQLSFSVRGRHITRYSYNTYGQNYQLISVCNPAMPAAVAIYSVIIPKTRTTESYVCPTVTRYWCIYCVIACHGFPPKL